MKRLLILISLISTLYCNPPQSQCRDVCFAIIFLTKDQILQNQSPYINGIPIQNHIKHTINQYTTNRKKIINIINGSLSNKGLKVIYNIQTNNVDIKD